MSGENRSSADYFNSGDVPARPRRPDPQYVPYGEEARWRFWAAYAQRVADWQSAVDAHVRHGRSQRRRR